VVDVAREFFGFREDARLRAHVGDGREFVEQARASSYDVIVLDAFGANSIPPRLATLEFLQAVRRALAPGGVAIANLWKPPQNPLYDAMVVTYRQAFDEVYSLDVEGYANQILLALPRMQTVSRNDLVQRARRLAADKRFGIDLAALVEAGYSYVPPPRDGRRARGLRDADFE
jgi:spermidine synthase